jgi:hypothetical protein
LPTDFTSPSGSSLARIPDQRTIQFWDPNHLVAQALNSRASSKPLQKKPGCCLSRGFYWDDVILYAPRAQWHDDPSPALLDGPVVHVIPALESALREIKP